MSFFISPCNDDNRRTEIMKITMDLIHQSLTLINKVGNTISSDSAVVNLNKLCQTGTRNKWPEEEILLQVLNNNEKKKTNDDARKWAKGKSII